MRFFFPDGARLALTLLAVSVLSLPAHAMDYYVSSKGNDTNPGTRARPWRTLTQPSQARFKAGDRLLLEGGATFTGTLRLDSTRVADNPDRPITITSYGKERALIEAGTGDGVLIENLGGVRVRNLIVDGGDRATNKGTGVKIVNRLPDAKKLSGIRIEQVEARNFRQDGIFVGGEPKDGSQSGFTNVQILQCVAHHNMYFGIRVAGVWDTNAKGYANRDVTVADCIAHDNPGDPKYTENHSGSGILLDDVEGGQIVRSIAYRNGAENAGIPGGPVGIWAHASDRILIERCESYENRTGGAKDGGGFDFDGGVTNSLMQYNYSHDNDGPGYLMWNYDKAPHRLGNNTLRYNLSINDGQKHEYGGIYIGTSGTPITNIHVHNNTVVTRPHANATPQALWLGGGTNTGFRIENNLFVTTGDVPLVFVNANQQELALRGNAYWNPDGGKDRFRFAGRSFDVLAAVRDQAGQEVENGAATGLWGDPKIALPADAPTVGDPKKLTRLTAFRPQAGSPLVGAGVAVKPYGATNAKLVTRDFWGQPIRAGKPFVGAGQ